MSDYLEQLLEVRAELDRTKERVEDLLDRKAELCVALQDTGRALREAYKEIDELKKKKD